MQIIRTIILVLLLLALLVFCVANWEPTVTVRIWQGLVLDTKLPAIVILSFLLGFLPMWAYHAIDKWHLLRRLQLLRNTASAAAGGSGAAALVAPGAAPASQAQPQGAEDPPDPAASAGGPSEETGPANPPANPLAQEPQGQ